MQQIVLRSGQRYANPFADVKVHAVFSSGGADKLVEGFYDGEQTWKVRFMPETDGQWTFKTVSDDRELTGITGSFEVESPSLTNHGPVRIANVHHFSYADGTPFFPLGTTLYNWLNRDRELEDRTLISLANSPFTKVRFFLFPKWMIYNRTEPAVYPYVRSADGAFDFDRFDPAFFSHVETRIRELRRLGIEADLILFHPYDKWGFAAMGRAQDDAFIRYVTARFSAFRNVWWTMCNEFNFFDQNLHWNLEGNLVENLEAKDWDGMFGTLQQADPYDHPKGMHNSGPWYDHAKPWITHVVVQEPRGLGRLSIKARNEYNKPVVVDEYGYEGNTGYAWGELSAREVVDRHWQLTLGGAYGSHGETYVHPGGKLWWSVGGSLVGDSPARLGFLKEVMTALPFQDLEPATESVIEGSALRKRSECYLFYFPALTAEPAQIETEGRGPYQVDMIDPWQMQIYPLGHTSAGAQAFVPIMFPTLLRLTRAADGDASQPMRSLMELLAEFVGETTEPRTHKLRSFSKTESMSTDWLVSELLADERAKEVLWKWAPAAVTRVLETPWFQGFAFSFLRYLGFEPLPLAVIDAELSQIPTD